jgi:serine/threonine-protein kinase RsbW
VTAGRPARHGGSTFSAYSIVPAAYRWRDRHIDSPHLELRIANRLEEIARVHRAVDSLAERLGLDPGTRRQLNVIFDELLNNTISYGYDDDREHEIAITITVSGGRLRAAISDDGRPFNPLERASPDTSLPADARPIGGLGVHLVRHLVDHVSYERRGATNVVLLEKQLPPAGN